MDFILTDLQKSIIGLSLFLILPGVISFFIWNLIALLPENIFKRIL